MIPQELRQSLIEHIEHVEHPRELVVDVMFAIQDHYGYLTDEGVQETASRYQTNNPTMDRSPTATGIANFRA